MTLSTPQKQKLYSTHTPYLFFLPTFRSFLCHCVHLIIVAFSFHICFVVLHISGCVVSVMAAFLSCSICFMCLAVEVCLSLWPNIECCLHVCVGFLQQCQFYSTLHTRFIPQTHALSIEKRQKEDDNFSEALLSNIM